MIHLLDLFGTAVFAATGALAAGRKHMDVFGVVVVALVTALGGGTARDIVLGVGPVFWVQDAAYVVVAVCAALSTFVLARFARLPERALVVADAFGLAVFTAIGAQKAFAAGAATASGAAGAIGLIAVIMGVMTGVVGGMARDVLCGEIPLILRKEIYATASLAGAVAFVLLRGNGAGRVPATAVAVAVVLVVRLAAIHWRLSLPLFPERGGEADS
jgi:uncharacterized membrane protein YeiH